MDYQDYRDSYFVDPPPAPRFAYTGLQGATLYFQDYEQAVAYYQQVLGPPGYVEGAGTKSWRLGGTWLTLLRGQDGNPHNAELMLVMPTAQEAERLQAAFIAAGGQGADPVDTLMYEPVRACFVTDPFGVNIMIFSRRLAAPGG